MKVLSLFDGISGARMALANLGIKTVYYSSEIDNDAMSISQKHYPDIIRLGDVRDLNATNLPKDIDLLIGGSPCQDLSITKRNREGLQGSRSGLFWEYVRILRIVNPKYFILENVASMKKEDKDSISEVMGVEPILINSALVTAQQRKRLYWTNIPNITQPQDRKIYLKDILEEGGYTERLKSYCITATYNRAGCSDYFKHNLRQLVFNKPVRLGTIGNGGQGERIYSVDGKSICLSANGGDRGAKTGLYEIEPYVRKLTPIECERLQGIKDNFTEGLSDNKRYKCIGNGFTIPVIEHILGFIDKETCHQERLF